MAPVRKLMLVLACELNEYMEMQYYTIISAIIAMVALVRLVSLRIFMWTAKANHDLAT